MSLSINTNRVDVTKQVDAEFAQGSVQEENGAARAESQFILMKGNQHATLSKLGLAAEAHQDNIKAKADCENESCCMTYAECDEQGSCPDKCSLYIC